MSDPEYQTQPLIGAQTAVNVPAAQGGRSSRAYKVAGLTLLACVLIAGQAMMAYFLLSQRGDIKSLEEQSNKMQQEMVKGRSGGVAKFSSASAPMRMHVPMKALPELMDANLDEEASTEAPERIAPEQPTDCQLEALGLKAVPVPGFRPTCDKRGLYQAQQCFLEQCWCVNPADGEMIPGSMRTGQASCRVAVFTGGLNKVLTLSDVNA